MSDLQRARGLLWRTLERHLSDQKYAKPSRSVPKHRICILMFAEGRFPWRLRKQLLTGMVLTVPPLRECELRDYLVGLFNAEPEPRALTALQRYTGGIPWFVQLVDLIYATSTRETDPAAVRLIDACETARKRLQQKVDVSELEYDDVVGHEIVRYAEHVFGPVLTNADLQARDVIHNWRFPPQRGALNPPIWSKVALRWYCAGLLWLQGRTTHWRPFDDHPVYWPFPAADLPSALVEAYASTGTEA